MVQAHGAVPARGRAGRRKWSVLAFSFGGNSVPKGQNCIVCVGGSTHVLLPPTKIGLDFLFSHQQLCKWRQLVEGWMRGVGIIHIHLLAPAASIC